MWAQGNTGAGVKVAVLDSGADLDHADLAGQVDGTADFVPTDQDTTDVVGHGTHVASTIAGTGATTDGKERGVASGARLEIGKALSPGARGRRPGSSPAWSGPPGTGTPGSSAWRTATAPTRCARR